MAKSDQDPSNKRREDAKDQDGSSDSSAKKTLMGIGDRLRAAREGKKNKPSSNAGSGSDTQGRKRTNRSIPRPGDRDGMDLGDTPDDPEKGQGHRRTAAMSADEAEAAAQGDLADTGPQTIEVTEDDEEEIAFLDDDAILEAEPVDEMEGESTMLSDSLFPEDAQDAQDAGDAGPDPNYDVGKTEVSIQSLDDFENEQRQRRQQDHAGDRSTAHLDQDAQRQQNTQGSQQNQNAQQDKRTRQQFPDSESQGGQNSGSFPEPADTPADRPSRRGQQSQPNPPTPEAGRSGQINRADVSGSQPQAASERSSRVFPKSPTPREEQAPMGDTPDSGVQQPGEALPADEFEDEKTEVFNSPYEREAVVPKLSALSGPSSGQEFLLNKMRNSVGRGNNNTVMVPDLAMSRRHFEVAKNPDESFTLRDLQSANGTVLNGTAVKEAELIHGDRIEVGKTTFQFVHPDQQRSSDGSRHLVPSGGTQPSAPMKASSGNNQTVSDDDRTGQVLNYVIIIAMAVSVVLAVPVAYLLFFDDSGDQSSEPTAESLASKGASQDLIAVYLEGVQAVKDREWNQAQARFEEVKSMDPDFERVNQQLARIRREKTNMSRLEKAQTLANNGEVAEAADMAGKIGQESVYFEDAQSLVRRSKRVDIDERYQKAVTAFGEDDYEAAMNHVEAVLEEVPEHQGALDLKEKLETSIAEAEAEKEEQAEEAERESKNVAVRRRPPRSDDDSDEESSGSDGLFDMDGDWSGGSDSSGSESSGSSAGGSADFSKGYSLYKSKSFTAAAAYFNSLARKHSGSDASSAKSKASSVRKFQSSYESANAAYGRGDYNSAIKGYTSARSLDKKVSSSGFYQSKLANQLANSYGKRGLSQLRKNQYSSAYSSYRSGKRYSSSNSTLRTLRQTLTNKARGLYIQAVNKRKSDPAKARALCDTITSMIAPSEPTYQKAKKLQNDL